MSSVLIVAASLLLLAWGTAHILPVSQVLAGFGKLSLENSRVVLMEWVAEGVTIVFLGILPLVVLLAAGPRDPVATVVFRMTAAMLLTLAALSVMTGARNALLPMKLCPIVKSAAALLLVIASLP